MAGDGLDGGAIGYALAAAVNAVVLPRFGWRAVLLVGLVPCSAVIGRRVEESPLWLSGARAAQWEGPNSATFSAGPAQGPPGC